METLPNVIESYLLAADAKNWDNLVACFTEQATVTDEGETYRGRDAIRRWREAAATKYTFTSTVLSKRKVSSDKYEVISELRGNFPGGEATLNSIFVLEGDLISDLQMT